MLASSLLLIYIIMHWFGYSIGINSLRNYWVKRFVHLKLMDTTVWAFKMPIKFTNSTNSECEYLFIHTLNQQWILSLLNNQMVINSICIFLITSEAVYIIRCALAFSISCLVYQLLLDSLYLTFYVVVFVLGICENPFYIMDTMLSFLLYMLQILFPIHCCTFNRYSDLYIFAWEAHF